ncbi:putative acetyltransferase [Smittium culicis]|uniref:Putative acetyltransferase n=1 Tax=Smittium culicis TaxID=133412 RepID=A0A1R1Y440_9FUNG|nr:putative acetyltransferase [Smittium culicis]OMJ08953.1 putative acetyltransferase [Smittium culicis]OMJ21619.1 putative acetyltransferase [Smittium culicis]
MTKSEYEKMITGELYLGGHPDLVALRRKSKDLVSQMQSSYNDKAERVRLTKELLGTSDETTYLEKYAYFDYGINTHVGKNFYMNAGCVILDCGRVDIGNDVMFGPNVQIYTVTHPLEAQLRISGQEYSRPIKIGDNVWIGGGSIVLPGITIGNNSVVAAGSVVTKDVPENVVVAGNPAKFMKKIDN